jgi:hypothetical protein
MSELPRDPHRPEDVDTDGPDHWYDGARYLIMSIGGGAGFPLFDSDPETAVGELLQALGPQVAHRPREAEQRDWWDDEDTPQRGTVQASPFL